MKIKLDPNTWLNLFIIGAGGFLAYKYLAFVREGLKPLTDAWKKFGVNDAVGQAISDRAEAQAMERGTQFFYNEVMRVAAANYGFTRTLDIQGTFVWPWVSYQNWKQDGTPVLPYEDTFPNGAPGS